MHRRQRRQAEAPADLFQARRVAVLLDELVQVIQDFALALGEWDHARHAMQRKAKVNSRAFGRLHGRACRPCAARSAHGQRPGVGCRPCVSRSSSRLPSVRAMSSGSGRTAWTWSRWCASSRPATRSSGSSASPAFLAGRSPPRWSAVRGSAGARDTSAASDRTSSAISGASSLTAEGVDVTAAETIPGAHTRFAMIIVDGRTGDRTVLWDRDARLAFTAGDVPAEAVRSARVLLVDCDDVEASVAAAASHARRRDHGDRCRSRRARDRSPAAAHRRRDCLRGLPRALDGLVRHRAGARAARRASSGPR